MPIIASVDNPFTSAQLASAWIYCRVASFDFGEKTGRLLYEVYADRESAYGGKPPLKTFEVILGTPAEYGSPPLLSPYVPAVYETATIREPGTNGPEDQGEYEAVEVSPAQDPVYGPSPLVRPAVPSLEELVSANEAAYLALQSVVDQLALGLPEFTSGEIEEIQASV